MIDNYVSFAFLYQSACIEVEELLLKMDGDLFVVDRDFDTYILTVKISR